jgi:3-keto-5-aminohexanoate cleavage enzyme
MTDDKVIITAALAGAETTREQNPAIPYTPEEFAEEARKARESGAAVAHIHVRDPDTGVPTRDPEQIGATIQAIRDRCPDLIINMSTAIVTSGEREVRINPILALRPAMASLNTNSMNFAFVDWKSGHIVGETVFENPFSMIVEFASRMRDAGVKPELEVYDTGGLFNVLLLRKQGIFADPMHFQMVFGTAGGVPYHPSIFSNLLSHLPARSTYSVCGVGPNQFRAAMTAVVNGGHLRVGLEDNVRMPDGARSRGSWEQVEWASGVARLAGREVADPAEARRILGITESASEGGEYEDIP